MDMLHRFIKKINVLALSLFDGMSCGQIAFEKAGIPIYRYYASELDKYAIQVTQHNYPKTIQLGDVIKLRRYLEKPELYDRMLETSFVKFENKRLIECCEELLLLGVDILIGGSPCQGFSFAGKQLNFEDIRSKLFFEFVKIKEILNPKYFLLENVNMKAEYRNIISECLGEEPLKINSNLVSAQNRGRLYWTNIRGVERPEDRKELLEDVWDGGEDITERVKAKRIGTLAYTKAWANMRTLKDKSRAILSGGQGISNTGATNVEIKGKYYRITCKCSERLQTVPDNYTSSVSNTQRYKMLGNGWTVDVIAHIFKNINR